MADVGVRRVDCDMPRRRARPHCKSTVGVCLHARVFGIARMYWTLFGHFLMVGIVTALFCGFLVVSL